MSEGGALGDEGDADGEEQRLVAFDLDRERILNSEQGRRGWMREGRRQLDELRRQQARPIAASRADRLRESKRRLEEEHRVELEANAAYEAYKARGVMRDGRRFGKPPKPYVPPAKPTGTINPTDHDSRIVRTTGQPARQGYNAQAAVTEHQVIIAAEVTIDSPDFGHLEPMVDATQRELEAIGVSSLPETVVADPGYWHKPQMENIVTRGIQVLIPPDSGLRTHRGRDGTRGCMRSCAWCCPPSSGKRCIEDGWLRSSLCSARSSSIAGLIVSNDEAYPP